MMVQYLNLEVLLMKANIECPVILAVFPDYRAKKKIVLSPNIKLCRGSRLWRRKHPRCKFLHRLAFYL